MKELERKWVSHPRAYLKLLVGLGWHHSHACACDCYMNELENEQEEGYVLTGVWLGDQVGVLEWQTNVLP